MRTDRWKALGIVSALLFSACAITIGFNTIDSMTWTFYWSEGRWHLWYPNEWAWTPSVFYEVYLSYALGGIIPFGGGLFLLGFLKCYLIITLTGRTQKL